MTAPVLSQPDPITLAPGTTQIVQLVATDADGDGVEYFTYGASAVWMSVNRSTGELTLSPPPDESTENHVVYAYAQSTVDNQSSNSVTISITVSAANAEQYFAAMHNGEQYYFRNPANGLEYRVGSGGNNTPPTVSTS